MTPEPGDIVFAHSNGFMGRAIRLGEHLRHPPWWLVVLAVLALEAVGTFVHPWWGKLLGWLLVSFAYTQALFGPHKGDNWNHVCAVDRIDEEGNIYVLQAEPHGVTNDKTIDTVGTYTIIKPPPGCDAERALWFGRQQLEDPYGWPTIAAEAFDVLTPDWVPLVSVVSRRGPTWICSTLVAEMYRFGGWYHEWKTPMPKPDDVWAALA